MCSSLTLLDNVLKTILLFVSAEYVIGRASCSFNEELVFVFPIINLLASPSKSVKAAAIDFLSLLERLFATISAAPKKVTTPVGFSSTSRPEYIIFRLIHHLWSQVLFWSIFLATYVSLLINLNFCVHQLPVLIFHFWLDFFIYASWIVLEMLLQMIDLCLEA